MDITNTSCQYIKGVGPKRADVLEKAGIKTIDDLLHYFPHRYEDRSNLMPISRTAVGNAYTLRGKIAKVNMFKSKKGIWVFEAVLSDASGNIKAVWFNRYILKRILRPGLELIVYGKITLFKEKTIENPEFEIIEDEDKKSVHIGRIVPIYPLSGDMNQKAIRSLEFKAVDEFTKSLADFIPHNIKVSNKFIEYNAALHNIHFPQSKAAYENSRRRLVFDEFFILQLILGLSGYKLRQADGISHNTDGDLIKRFLKLVPFKFTDAQKRVIAEIESDMKSPKPMRRLLQGDVGSGKTIVAAYALVLTVQNGFQGALMAPTEILARQHYIRLSQSFAPLGIKVGLLVSSLTPKDKDEIYRKIENGELDIVIGTHALIEGAANFKKLGLVVIDEQHKFGVSQRQALMSKSASSLRANVVSEAISNDKIASSAPEAHPRNDVSADVLVMTATPIPRTLALTICADFDISFIDELPKGRNEIKTFWFDEKERFGIYKFIEGQIRAGRQAYIVYPVIEDSKKGLKSAVNMFEKLWTEFNDFKLALLHSQIATEEKQEIMDKFGKGEIDILVSTIVIEVGIDVKNATVMLIEHADRFGLAQLHQLRGRIGRGEHESFCILLAEPKTDDAKQRLEAILNTQDGLKIAQKDLEIRGPGDFFGQEQSGNLFNIRIGDFIKDVDTLELAKKEAANIINKDPKLSNPENHALKSIIERRFPKAIELLEVG